MSSYATYTELQTYGLPAAAIGSISTADQQSACDAASSIADGYLAARFHLPLATWSTDIKVAVCKIAASLLMQRRGYNPDGGSDPTIRDGYMDAIKWLRDVAEDRATPNVTVSGGDGPESAPRIYSATPRGW